MIQSPHSSAEFATAPTATPQSPIPHLRRAYSLIELLICVVIIAILSAISLNAYNGSLDQSELKFVTPQLTRELESLRKESLEKNLVISVTFELNTPNYSIRRGSASAGETTPAQLGGGILKRKLRFLRFEALEGGTAPPTITFLPTNSHQGGTIFLGSGKAEQSITVNRTAVSPSFVP